VSNSFNSRSTSIESRRSPGVRHGIRTPIGGELGSQIIDLSTLAFAGADQFYVRVHSFRGNRTEDTEVAVISGLKEQTGKNMRGNVHRGQANYAPKPLREKSDVASPDWEDELATAMNRLVK
jgi:hypothetical protein